MTQKKCLKCVLFKYNLNTKNPHNSEVKNERDKSYKGDLSIYLSIDKLTNTFSLKCVTTTFLKKL